ncbi:aldo/keto reductase [Nocardioides mangrovi]|uniref:Aldo/keto reductase n=1 Tax=Nocardioides mangrovi TaxID=2874580 RepID=A0ABS7UCC0_9ACTN|nr:aldo/keto reductase [Nocardioides mangrovi]MBZ5738649.1 aldo/keto reductase [Nocardioides mangrovi]
MTQTTTATDSGTFSIGGDLPVVRLGYGTMQLPGEGVWGPPKDHGNAMIVLRRAVELGITLFDTADSYGPETAEQLLRDALHPYPDDLVIATKAGLTRQGPGIWTQLGFPPYLRQQCELSLRRLGVETIDLFQLHRIDKAYPLEDQVGELKKLQEEGKIRHIGLSEVSVEQLEAARKVAEITTVQNLYNLGNRSAEALLDNCEQEGIGFIPWFPLATGELSKDDGPLADASHDHGATPSQLALAWLLRRSSVMLPIPGTSSVAHLEQNTAAAQIELTDEEFERLSAINADLGAPIPTATTAAEDEDWRSGAARRHCSTSASNKDSPTVPAA